MSQTITEPEQEKSFYALAGLLENLSVISLFDTEPSQQQFAYQLPKPEPHTIFIVTEEVAKKHPEREDLIFPWEEVQVSSKMPLFRQFAQYKHRMYDPQRDAV